MVNILKRRLDQALQGGKGAQGLEIFCKLLKSKTQHQNSKPKTQPLSKTLKCKKNCFSPEPIYSNSNAMFFVEEKGSKFQVNGVLKKMQNLADCQILYFDKFDCFR